MVKSIDFDRFMTLEGTKTLILAFTSKTRKPVDHTRHRIFYLFVCFFLSEREDTLRYFIGLFSVLDKELNK